MRRIVNYNNRWIIYTVSIFLYCVIAGLYTFQFHKISLYDFWYILLSIVSVGLAVLAIIQSIKTDKIINTISVGSYYVENPWLEGKKLIDSVNEGAHIYAVNVTMPWPDEDIYGVKEYKQANKEALKKDDIHITRIFAYPLNLQKEERGVIFLRNLIKEATTQHEWDKIKMNVFVYQGEDALMDYCLVVEGGQPINAVLWLHDPEHPRKPLPGFCLENKMSLKPIWENFQKIKNSKDTIYLHEFIAKHIEDAK